MKSRFVPVVVVSILVLIACGVVWWAMFASSGDAALEGEPVEATLPASPNQVVLPAEKLAAARIRTERAQVRRLQETTTLPGRLQYDDTRHIEIKLPVAGILSEVRVKPGDAVTEGQVLAVLSSPELGNARADVLRNQSQLDLAETKRSWTAATCQGLEQLVGAVQEGQDADVILDEMETISLGDYRAKVISAYSRYLLAAKLAGNVTRLANSGALPSTTTEYRRSELYAAEAELKAVMEQSLFDARQAGVAADAAVADAGRRLKISQQYLQTLLGYATPQDEGGEDAQTLSYVEVRAPFAGTIEEKYFATSERIEPGDALFVLADTSRLWVVADIRERDWGAMNLQPGQELQVGTASMADCALTAEVYFLGREVSAATNAVPLIATLNNRDGTLRPGQFVRVTVPMDVPHDVLAVPGPSIVEHDGQPFVFVQQSPDCFRRVDIVPGISADGWTEVTQGLEADAVVVSDGAFYLKSELLLAGEEGAGE